jgi:hypothetical protein
MADLLDIAPSTASEAVWVDGVRVTVRGVSVDAIASIIARFPELRALVNGDDIVPRLIQGCGAAVGPIIAAGCGHLADDAYEQHATKLLPQHQLKFLRAIFGLTFPNGIGSFVEELTGLIGGAGEGAKTIKLRSKKSPSPSSPSSGEASHPTLQ